jgi:hypothetical protein
MSVKVHEWFESYLRWPGTYVSFTFNERTDDLLVDSDPFIKYPTRSVPCSLHTIYNIQHTIYSLKLIGFCIGIISGTRCQDLDSAVYDTFIFTFTY